MRSIHQMWRLLSSSCLNMGLVQRVMKWQTKQPHHRKKKYAGQLSTSTFVQNFFSRYLKLYEHEVKICLINWKKSWNTWEIFKGFYDRLLAMIWACSLTKRKWWAILLLIKNFALLRALLNVRRETWDRRGVVTGLVNNAFTAAGRFWIEVWDVR